MSAVGACIIMKALSQGMFINQILVYGIVTLIDETLLAKLIQKIMPIINIINIIMKIIPVHSKSVMASFR